MNLPVNYRRQWLRQGELQSQDLMFIPPAFRPNGVGSEGLRRINRLCLFFRTSVHDRSETLTMPLRMVNLYPIPKDFEGFQLRFADLCLARAKQIIETGKRIDIFWSGGIDSTAVLVAFLRAGAAREQIKVLMTHNSIMEYSWFYHRIIKPNCNHELLTHSDVKNSVQLEPQKIVVTGELGDQIFGSWLIARHSTAELFRPYDQIIHAEIVRLLEPLIASAPLRIETLFDFYWYANLVLKWQPAATRFLIGIPGAHPDHADQLIHFFNTEDFQRWSLVGREPKILETHRTYKWTAKEFIYDFTADRVYRDNKLKVISLRNVQPGDWRIVLRDGKTLFQNDIEALGGRPFIARHPHDSF